MATVGLAVWARSTSLLLVVLCGCADAPGTQQLDAVGLGDGRFAFEIPPHQLNDPAVLLPAWPYPDRAEIDGAPVPLTSAIPGLIPLPPGAKQLVLHVEGERPVRRGALGNTGEVLAQHLQIDFWQFAIGSVLCIGGVVLLAGTLARQRMYSMRGLAAFALSMGLLSIGQSPGWASLIIPSAAFWENVRFISVYTFPLGFAVFVVDLFGDTKHRVLRFVSLGLAVYLVASVALVLLDVATSTAMRRFTYLFTLTLIGVTLWHVFQQRKSDASARLFLLGFALLSGFSVTDILWALGYPLLPINGAPFGMFAFAVCGTLILVRRASEQRVAAELARTELAAQLVQVRLLNDELRTQVERRSRELKELLAGGLDTQGLHDELEVGEVVDGRYTVTRKLGSGAMGSVYEVIRSSDARRLALKVLTGTVTSTEAARFAREAEIAARLHHPNLVGIVDIGLVSRRFVYLVMELVEGRTLEQAREQYGKHAEALRWLQQISSGLMALHEAGFVHRDLKPTNILLARPRNGGDEVARIADFGVAREVRPTESDDGSDRTHAPMGSAGLKLTSTGAMVGTPFYMAPEGVRGQGSQPFDVYSFGLIAFELLTARYPFAEPPAMSLLSGRKVPPAKWPADIAIDTAVSAAVIRCLSEAPGDRPTARELAGVFGSPNG